MKDDSGLWVRDYQNFEESQRLEDNATIELRTGGDLIRVRFGKDFFGKDQVEISTGGGSMIVRPISGNCIAVQLEKVK